MQFRHHLPLMLLLMWGLVDVGVLVTFSILEAAGQRSLPLFDSVFFGLVIAQGSLVACWFYLSDHWSGWHVLSLLVMIACLAVCTPAPLWVAGMMLVHVLILAVVHYPLGMLRDRGWRYRFHPMSLEDRRPWQFSLSDLVGFTFLVAVCLGLWMLLGRAVSAEMISSGARLVLSLGLLAWLPGIRILVGTAKSPWMIAAWAAAATVHLRLTVITLSSTSRGEMYFEMIAACGVILVLQAAALRWAGWRIVGLSRRKQQSAAAGFKPPPPSAADAVSCRQERKNDNSAKEG